MYATIKLNRLIDIKTIVDAGCVNSNSANLILYPTSVNRNKSQKQNVANVKNIQNTALSISLIIIQV